MTLPERGGGSIDTAPEGQSATLAAVAAAGDGLLWSHLLDGSSGRRSLSTGHWLTGLQSPSRGIRSRTIWRVARALMWRSAVDEAVIALAEPVPIRITVAVAFILK